LHINTCLSTSQTLNKTPQDKALQPRLNIPLQREKVFLNNLHVAMGIAYQPEFITNVFVSLKSPVLQSKTSTFFSAFFVKST